jgi:hypothetical protein
VRHVRDVVAAENLTPITWTRRDGFMFSDDPADRMGMLRDRVTVGVYAGSAV